MLLEAKEPKYVIYVNKSLYSVFFIPLFLFLIFLFSSRPPSHVLGCMSVKCEMILNFLLARLLSCSFLWIRKELVEKCMMGIFNDAFFYSNWIFGIDFQRTDESSYKYEVTSGSKIQKRLRRYSCQKYNFLMAGGNLKFFEGREAFSKFLYEKSGGFLRFFS